MGRTSGWRITVLVVSVATLVAGAASGAGATAAGRSKASTRIARASSALSDAGSARFDGTVHVEADGKSVDMGVSGVMDQDHQSARLVMDTSGLGNDAPPSLPMLIAHGDSYISADYFRKLPGFADQLDGKQWVRVTPVGSAGDGRPTGDFGQSDPSGTIESLRGVSKDVTTIGPERVRGVATTHYRADLDLEKALAHTPPGKRAQVRKLMAQLGGRLPLDVWLDDHDRPRRMTIEIEVSPGGQHVDVAETIDFFDYGVNVDVEAPPAAQVIDATDLAHPGLST